MKISILMASYNSEKTIKTSIQSFLNQSLLDKELIVIDGESNDQTLKIVENFNSPCIHLISEPDDGVYDALNKGLKIANGEWIYVMGSDDILFSDTVLEDVFIKNIPENTSIIYGEVISNFYKNKKQIKFDYPEILLKKYNNAPPIFHQAIFFKKEQLDQLDGFNTYYKIYADFDLLCRSSKANLIFWKIPTLICLYNASGLSGISKTNFLSNSREFKNVLINNNSLNLRWRIRLLKNYFYFIYSLIR